MSNEGSILSRTPDEIWLKIISNLDDELDQIMLSRACRRTRDLFPLANFAMVAHLLEEEQVEMLKLRIWNDLVKLDGTRQPADRAACVACKKAHDISAFETEMLEKPASDRVCRGVLGLFRVCEHKVVDFSDIQLALTKQNMVLLCGEHPHKNDVFDERIFWNVGLMIDPKKKEIKSIANDEYNVVGVWSIHPCLPTGFERALERKFLEAILAKDEKHICRHLRRCDLVATYSQDEDLVGKGKTKVCSHPACLTTYTFAGVKAGTVVLQVVQYFGTALSPNDPYWLEAISEMREIKEVDETVQIQVDAEREVDTQEQEVVKGEEEDDHPAFNPSQEDTMARRDMGSATSRHPPGDDYPQDSDGDCMCAGSCLDCTAWRRQIPLPRMVSTPRGTDWIFPGDVGFYVYR